MNQHRIRVSTVCAMAALTLAMGQNAAAVERVERTERTSERSTERTTERTAERSPEQKTQQHNTQQQKQQSAGLTPLSADAIESVDKPQPGGEFTDPAYGTHVHRATAASDGEGGRVRHEYSRRQAFNADNSRYLAQDGRGAWYL